MPSIRKVAVIGAGTMGAGIAAQVANAGVPVLLLDVVPDGARNRNALAESAVGDSSALGKIAQGADLRAKGDSQVAAVAAGRERAAEADVGLRVRQPQHV